MASGTRQKSDIVNEVNLMLISLQRLETDIVAAATDAMQRGTNRVYESAVNTTAYEDDTTATRNSTVTYVSDRTNWPPNEIGVSRATADTWRPGSGDPNNAPPIPARNEIVLDAVASTMYAYALNTRFGGQSMFLANAILENSGPIFADVEREVERAFSQFKPVGGTP